MAISNNLGHVKTYQFDRNVNENVKYKDINEVQALFLEEYSRSNQIGNYNVRIKSTNIIVTKVEVHEVPNRIRKKETQFEEESMVNKVAFKQIQKPIMRKPSGKTVNVDCESDIIKSKSEVKIENNTTERQKKRQKFYNPNEYMDLTCDATLLPISTVIALSDNESYSKTNKTRRRGKIIKSQKKTKAKTKRASPKSKILPPNNCGTLERSSTTSNSNVFIYQRLISILGGCSSVTEYIQKKKEASANRSTSTRVPIKKRLKPLTIKDVAEIMSCDPIEHHAPLKRKSAEGHSKDSKKICRSSNVTLCPTKTRGYFDGNEFGLDQVRKQLQNDEDQQKGHDATHSLVEVPPNVKHWVGTSISYEKCIVIRSQNYIGKHLLLVYFPSVFSSTANVISDVKLLDEKSDMLAEENIEILIITMDSPHSILTWIYLNNLQSLKLPVLSDINRDISKANNFSTHLRGFSLINPEGEQVYLIGYMENFTLNIDKILAEIKQF